MDYTVTQSLPLFLEPDPERPDLAISVLKDDTVEELPESVAAWAHVKLRTGEEGYIPWRYLDEAEEVDLPDPGPANNGAAGPVFGSSFEQKAADIISNLIRDLRLDDFQAAGIVGNLAYESGQFKDLQEKGVTNGRGGYGWAQWTAKRRLNFERWTREMGLSPDSDAANYGFLKQELEGSYSQFTARLRQTSTVDDATSLTHRQYETPSDALPDRFGNRPTFKSGPQRLGFAKEALAAFKSRPAG